MEQIPTYNKNFDLWASILAHLLFRQR